jgi:short-subunit dehydrogenase
MINPKQNEYAVVTGGASGIGNIYVRNLLTIGYNIIIVSPHECDINELKSVNSDKDVILLKHDLTKLDECKEVVEETKKYFVSLIINNSGIGAWGETISSKFEDELQVINLNVIALHYLTKLFVQRFEAQKYGRVINIASIAAFIPAPLFANYYASKSYDLSYGQAFNTELKMQKSNVRVVTICPGFLNTSFFAHSTSSGSGKNPYLPALKPEKFVAKSIKRALNTKNKNYILVGAFTKVC